MESNMLVLQTTHSNFQFNKIKLNIISQNKHNPTYKVSAIDHKVKNSFPLDVYF